MLGSCPLWLPGPSHCWRYTQEAIIARPEFYLRRLGTLIGFWRDSPLAGSIWWGKWYVGEFNSLATNTSRCHHLSTFPQSLSGACGVSTSAHSIPVHVHVDFKEGGGSGLCYYYSVDWRNKEDPNRLGTKLSPATKGIQTGQHYYRYSYPCWLITAGYPKSDSSIGITAGY